MTKVSSTTPETGTRLQFVDVESTALYKLPALLEVLPYTSAIYVLVELLRKKCLPVLLHGTETCLIIFVNYIHYIRRIDRTVIEANRKHCRIHIDKVVECMKIFDCREVTVHLLCFFHAFYCSLISFYVTLVQLFLKGNLTSSSKSSRPT